MVVMLNQSTKLQLLNHPELPKKLRITTFCHFALKEMVGIHINFMAASTHDARLVLNCLSLNVKSLGCIGQGSLNVTQVANMGTKIHNSILQVVSGL
jgi:hypothetical protein